MQHSSTPSMDTMPTVISIDPPHSRDLDDAVSVMKDADGWTVDVCVPDVPSLVHPGDPLDERAMRRVMTRYGGSFIKEPMLPDETIRSLSLSSRHDTPMCWFRIRLSPDLTPLSTAFRRIVHRTHERLSYLEADEALARPRDRSHAEISAMWELAGLLHARRRIRTGAAFDPELHVYTTEEGVLARLAEKDSHRSHLIVMELMILANETLAGYARSNGIPIIYRNHVPRDASSGLREEIVAEMRAIEGMDADEAADRLRHVASRVGPATFGTEPRGHWGLDVPQYAWFTSPLRRACDIINLRALVHGFEHPDLSARAVAIEAETRKVREQSSQHHGLRSRSEIVRAVRAGDREALSGWDLHTIVRACVETGTRGDIVAHEADDRLSRGAVSGKDIEAVLVHGAAAAGEELVEKTAAWLMADPQRQLVLARDMVVRQRITRVPQRKDGEPDLAAAMKSIAAAIGVALPEAPSGQGDTRLSDPVVDHPNPKGALLERATAARAIVTFGDPVRVGPPHEPRFTVEGRWEGVDGKTLQETASASTVKSATKAVAYAILMQLGEAPRTSGTVGNDPDKPAKSRLLEMAVRNGATATFDDPVRSGPPHAPRFSVTARYSAGGEEVSAEGVAGSRREAERLAALGVISRMEAAK